MEGYCILFLLAVFAKPVEYVLSESDVAKIATVYPDWIVDDEWVGTWKNMVCLHLIWHSI